MGSKSAGQQQETPQEAALTQYAANQMQVYQQTWLPLQTKLASTISQEGVDGSQAQKLAEAKSSVDTKIAFQNANAKLQAGEANSGAGIGSGRQAMATSSLSDSQAGAIGTCKMMSDAQVKAGYVQGLSALSAIGQGQQAQVGNSMAEQAQSSVATSQAAAESALMQASGNAGAIGTAVGAAGKGASNAFGNQTYTGFNGTSGTGLTNMQPWAVGPPSE
jgi:hypothetical protein